ncbi:hypothetical protein SLEP1_g17666 [Rubroshorea leprosula]|uniref:RNA polymerase II nuclear localization protein SLC7A6OS n=1 Tax=Rubroshorea leprosula TaxID=152421 RepID=A0AAV5J0U6_9ROSI|nr:hypothetical protein SLEP1_g17666 [Rubroshorea leprosula]
MTKVHCKKFLSRNWQKNARFEQIWRSRTRKEEEVDEMCHFYEVVRVDFQESSNDKKEQQDMSLEDHRILTGYLPLLREFIPSAAEEIESDIQAHISSQVDDEDFYDVLYDSEYDSEDSNAEDNPRNYYPDEIPKERDELENGDVIAYENETYDDYEEEVNDSDYTNDNDNDDGEYWRWSTGKI